MRLSILPLALLAAGAPLAAAETHPFNIRDLVMMDRLSDLQVSPDGQWVAFVVRKTDFDANRGRTDVWLMPTAGGEARQLTRHEAGDDSPRWAADGKSLYFLSRRSGSSQIWRLPLTGGEAEQITKLPLDVSNLLLSPDGKYLAFSLEVFIDCADLACTQDRLSKAESAKETGRIYDRLFLRHWDSWEDGRRQHLFVLPVAGGTPLDLTRGLDADVPSMPFGGVEEWAFTPDGREMLFSARVAGASEPWSTNFDLYAVPVDGSAAPRNLTAGNPAWDTRPMFTPDGRSLVYLAMSRPGFEADRFRILIQPWPQGPAREVAPGWDRSPDQLVFSADGKTLYATANDLGRSALFALDVASGTSKRLVTDGSVHELARVGSDLLVLRDHLKGPNEIYRLGPDGSGFRALTSFNGERLAGLRMGEPEPFSFTGAKGETVHAWLIKPVDFDPGRKYPLAYLIHGGPQGSFKNEFHYRWNPQTYAGRGYAAVMVDFHGSTGYGQAFTDSISKDWGGAPLEDLQKGLAAVGQKYPWIDLSRAAALGGSYGGFMTNWIAGNWFDAQGKPPFRCLVTHSGVFDQREMYFATEELWFPEWEQGGTYYSNPAAHEKFNPAAHVDRWKTPMLVIHGALDFRIPETQGMAAFTALQRQGVPSRFLYFPDENHWILKPHNSVLWHDTVLDWLDRWTK